MLEIVWNDFSASPWMECMLRIVIVTWMSLSRAMNKPGQRAIVSNISVNCSLTRIL